MSGEEPSGQRELCTEMELVKGRVLEGEVRKAEGLNHSFAFTLSQVN